VEVFTLSDVFKADFSKKTLYFCAPLLQEELAAWAKELVAQADVQPGNYRRIFGWLEKLYNKVRFD
jgi:hypothetical protein